MKTVIQQINEYFAGQRTTFTLPLHVEGTPFQRKVWKLLLAIPYGETLSYSEIAKKLGNPNAARAVGMACRHNPIPIIIPCHRVVAKDGSLGGFSLGGVGVKRILRQLEQCHCWARIQKNT
ncbi:MAG: methylated-DNA--[protein]-cysteine S-methyltransferase [Deltaproteobacteria bacterium]|nr:methylated-DNA--[protein]-cysteine S-methyltransferase [Deltaproteobacteria bacterium]